jgi:D-glycero-D-manno-heptose 1,7-bisphosphate phosphatase
MKQKAVFIDRDGTLIEEVNFLSRAEDLRFFPFTDQAVKLLKENDFLVVVVTNQSGIGRKIFTEAAMREIHEAIQKHLTKKIDAFYFCPHLPGENCACRKPKTAMIERAAADFAIDLENSWFIGDKAIDVEAGRNANLKTALVLTGYGKQASEQLENPADLTTENLLEAAIRIVNRES